MSREPTRPASGTILELVLATVPQMVSNIQTKPGNSDHDIVLFDINMRPKLQRIPVRRMYQYDRANKDDIKTQCSQMTSTYFERNPDEITGEDNWLFFKGSILLIMSHISHRSCKAKTSHPYITREMNKRDRLYKKAIRTKSPKDWETYKTKIHSVQRLKESAYSEYLNNVVGESLMTDAKKFWRHVKAQR